jgi:hypothetical protein
VHSYTPLFGNGLDTGAPPEKLKNLLRIRLMSSRLSR